MESAPIDTTGQQSHANARLLGGKTVEQENDPCLEGDTSHEAKEKHSAGSGSTARTPVTNLGSACFAVGIGLLPIYFLVFAGLSFRNDQEPVLPGSEAAWLLAAANYGPTALPIVFAAIVGQLFTSIAAWRLERTVSLGLLEYLVASRSLGSAFVSLLKLRYFSLYIPPILIAWCLSPLAGQSALRIVTSMPLHTTTQQQVSYLNMSTTAREELSDLYSDFVTSEVDATFTTSLLSPPSSKNGSQDLYLNVQIPFMELLDTEPSSDGWREVVDEGHPVHASLLGIPVAGVQAASNTTFTLETSYIQTNCSVIGRSYANNSEHMQAVAASGWNTTIMNGFLLDFSINVTDLYGDNLTGRAYSYYQHSSDESSPETLPVAEFDSADSRTFAAVTDYPAATIFDATPSHDVYLNASRVIGFRSESYRDFFTTEAWCVLSTTYTEARVKCSGGPGNCSVISMRPSLQATRYTRNVTFLDQMNDFSFQKSGGSATQFFWTLMKTESAKSQDLGELSRLELFFVSPDAPTSQLHGTRRAVPPIATIGDELFSIRFAQLLNTYWLSYTSSSEVTGGFSDILDPDRFNSQPAAVMADVETMQIVVRVHRRWAAVLIFTSLLLIATGFVTAFLELNRKAPMVLDSFASSLKHSPYVDFDRGECTEDGTDMARRLRHLRVKIGDVRPDEAVGHIAPATVTIEQRVQKLRRWRMYT